MFDAWGRFVHRHRRAVLAGSAVALVASVVWGLGVFGSLSSSSGFEVPGSESVLSGEAEAADLGRQDSDVVVLYESADRTVDDPAYRAAVTAALASLPADRVLSARGYFDTGSPRFVSADRRSTYVVLQLEGADEKARRVHLPVVREKAVAEGLTTRVGGQVVTQKLISDQVKKDIGIAEGIATPVLLVFMVVIFGSVVAASLSLAIGAVAIFGSFAVLHLLTLVTDVSIYSINITTLLGLGLAIDYGLFMLVRFREELARGGTTEDAVARTVATAGRTVAVSGVTVAVSLMTLLIFPQTFLRSMGFGGVATVLVDLVAALTVLPALLGVLGPRVNAGAPKWLVRRRDRERTGWARLARAVMRRPALFLLAPVALVVALGLPFLHASWGGIDARMLPAGTETREVSEALSTRFPDNATNPVTVVLRDVQEEAAAGFATRIDRLPNVADAVVTGAQGSTARITVTYPVDRMSAEARAIVTDIRGLSPPPGATVLVGGATAELVDQLDDLRDRLPWMALIIVLVTFVLLFLAFGSVLLPVKAIVVNLLSLSATFGALVWIFQDGHLSGLLGFTPTGMIEPSMPILVFAIIFGLSMDYEVFLLSRVREHYEVTGDNEEAVARGLSSTGGLITNAALLFVIVVAAFSLSGITFIKLIGVGMFIAVVVDATIVRALVVPAAMKLAGRANWWAPKPLRALHARFGIREGEVPAASTATAGRAPVERDPVPR
ncbi:MMPL family transporter [Saccharothrix xinjiangensis]|uniref:MMPL family transporter n=1 Tax=Saccharothrix xinjiangensis TaxID=204798 RepID=A0ABV9Y9Y6_9PSEU